MSRVRVVVTAEDIAAAPEPGSATGSNCPFARAVRVTGYPFAHVERSTWRPSGINGPRGYPLTRRAARFVARFDDGKPVQPATFYLEGPDQ